MTNLEIDINKIVLYICATAIFVFYIHSRQLNVEVIKSCESSCNGWSASVAMVTTTKCECAQREELKEKNDSIWVTPKGQ